METIICYTCGKEFERAKGEINRAKKLGRRFFCSRSCSGHQSPQAKNPDASLLRKGGSVKDALSPFREHLRRAKGRGKVCTITLDDLRLQWSLQGGKCPITGVPMGHPEKGVNHWSTASLDRVDSSRGYIPGNIRFVSIWANMARRHGTDIELIGWCILVVEQWGHLTPSELAEGKTGNIEFPWENDSH